MDQVNNAINIQAEALTNQEKAMSQLQQEKEALLNEIYALHVALAQLQAQIQG